MNHNCDCWIMRKCLFIICTQNKLIIPLGHLDAHKLFFLGFGKFSGLESIHGCCFNIIGPYCKTVHVTSVRINKYPSIPTHYKTTHNFKEGIFYVFLKVYFYNWKVLFSYLILNEMKWNVNIYLIYW